MNLTEKYNFLSNIVRKYEYYETVVNVYNNLLDCIDDDASEIELPSYFSIEVGSEYDDQNSYYTVIDSISFYNNNKEYMSDLMDDLTYNDFVYGFYDLFTKEFMDNYSEEVLKLVSENPINFDRIEIKESV